MSNIHLRAFTHPALALHIFYCMIQSLGMQAQQVVPACREKAILKKDDCTHWGEMKAFTNVLEKPGTVQMGKIIWRISQLNKLKRKIRNDPGIIFSCAKVTVMDMHEPWPFQGNTFFCKKSFYLVDWLVGLFVVLLLLVLLGFLSFLFCFGLFVCFLLHFFNFCFNCQSCTYKQDGSDLQAWLCIEKHHPCKGNNDFYKLFFKDKNTKKDFANLD